MKDEMKRADNRKNARRERRRDEVWCIHRHGENECAGTLNGGNILAKGVFPFCPIHLRCFKNYALFSGLLYFNSAAKQEKRKKQTNT